MKVSPPFKKMHFEDLLQNTVCIYNYNVIQLNVAVSAFDNCQTFIATQLLGVDFSV